MADVLLGSSERRVLISALPPAPESLLCRLDQIDSRVRTRAHVNVICIFIH
jgi:hypothetical protein